MSVSASPQASFRDLALSDPVFRAIEQVGYETPSPIQALTIPHLLQGQDILGQAQTGTGKTAAFALPLLSRIDLRQRKPQVLVLAPTRELAIQVAESFQRYARFLDGFHVLPIYGGQEYGAQIRALKRGVHVVVGTPGRVMDHMRKGTLDLGELKTLVLDEADEMLRMGFIDDVEWILQQTPDARQTALFSATMPDVIRRMTKKYLRDPQEVTIKVNTSTAETIRQRYWMVSGLHKLDALTRIMEVESFDAAIIFVRTKTATVELAEKLNARGYEAAALNGDMPQNQREQVVEKIKGRKYDILVATDVVARGLDIERISHVINYDIPYDTESYVHRIGRTGRAGRSGEAILFVAPRERKLLSAIERATRKKIEPMALPSTEQINDKRVARFYQNISDRLNENNLGFYQQLLENYEREHDVPAIEIAAALAALYQGDEPLLLKKNEKAERLQSFDDEKSGDRKSKGKKGVRNKPDVPMETYRIEVGHAHGVKPGNIVGAISNEVELDSEYIGHIKIMDDFSLVDLPQGMPADILRDLRDVWIAGQKARMSLFTGSKPAGKSPGKPAGKSFGKKPAAKSAGKKTTATKGKKVDKKAKKPRKA